jgi:hypothetical protein
MFVMHGYLHKKSVAFDICALLGLYAVLIGSVYRRFGTTYRSLFKGQAVQEEATLLLFLMSLLYSERVAL